MKVISTKYPISSHKDSEEDDDINVDDYDSDHDDDYVELEEDEDTNGEKKKKKKKDIDLKDESNKPEGDGTETLKFCSADQNLFQMQTNFKIRGKVIMEKQQRSAVQCATLCSQLDSCRAITYRVATKTCVLHSGKDFTMIGSKGYRAGVKTCD